MVLKKLQTVNRTARHVTSEMKVDFMFTPMLSLWLMQVKKVLVPAMRRSTVEQLISNSSRTTFISRQVLGMVVLPFRMTVIGIVFATLMSGVVVVTMKKMTLTTLTWFPCREALGALGGVGRRLVTELLGLGGTAWFSTIG